MNVDLEQTDLIVQTDINRFDANRTEWLGYIFYGLCRSIDAKITVEIGIKNGYISAWLVKAMLENKGVHFAIDMNDTYVNEFKRRIIDLKAHRSMQCIIKDSTEIGWHRNIDFMFIDSSHEYKYLIKELNIYAPWVKNGGYIALHDYNCCGGVNQAVAEYFKDKQDEWSMVELYKYDYYDTLLCCHKRKCNK